MSKLHQCQHSGCMVETTRPLIAGLYLCHDHFIRRDLDGEFTFEQMARYYEAKNKQEAVRTFQEIKKNG